jgi:hypothetical protein
MQIRFVGFQAVQVSHRLCGPLPCEFYDAVDYSHATVRGAHASNGGFYRSPIGSRGHIYGNSFAIEGCVSIVRKKCNNRNSFGTVRSFAGWHVDWR